MRGSARRQLLVLTVLVVILAGVAVVRGPDDPAAGAAQSAGVQSGQVRPTGRQAAVVDLKLEQLKAARGDLASANRNPFRFQQIAEPRPRPAVAPRPVIAPAAAPAGPPPIPPIPPIPLKFIGVMDQVDGVKVAILSDSRGNVFYGKEGAIIDGRYQLTRIGAESAELAYADGRGRQAIRLSGQ